jgi:hypothetical protein
MTKILDNGDLLVTADNTCRTFIAEEMRKGSDYWSILADIFEQERCNGGLEPFEPGNGEPHSGPFVGLTSAPCIAESMDYLDDGRQRITGRCWWYPDYATHDPLDDLKNRGRAVFAFGFDAGSE